MADMNDQEKQLVAWLSDMNEDDAFALAKRMLLEEGGNEAELRAVARYIQENWQRRYGLIQVG